MVSAFDRVRAVPSMLMRTFSGTIRIDGLVTVRSSTVTRPSRISARAALRLARPIFDSARSSETVFLAVVAKLERDPEVFRAQCLHGALQFVLRGGADPDLVGLDRRLDLLLQVL